MASQQALNAGVYVPSTNIWSDIQLIQSANVNSPEFKELLVRLYQNINLITVALNLKESAYYNTQEFVNSQLWFPNPAITSTGQGQPQFRQDSRMVVNMGPLPDAGTISIPHNINPTMAFSATLVKIAATNPTTGSMKWISIPWLDTAGNIISAYVDDSYVNITTNFDATAYTLCYAVVEYIKN